MKKRLLPLLALPLLLAPAVAATGDRWPLAEAPEPARARAEKARAGFQKLASTLQARLQAAMQEGGPVKAVEVCHLEAPELTASVQETGAMALGRTSARLRNPQNSPREWVQPYLERWAGRPASEAPVEVVDLGEGRLGVLGPIPTMPVCLTCHGDPGAMAPELREALSKAYPHDRATGFQLGDLRGVFWAELGR